MYRYKAFYSLDCDDGIENAAIGWAQPSPEDCLMEKEAQAEYAELLRRLYEAIFSLPPAQARRVHARYMLGMKVKDIAAMEGITPSQAGSPSMRRFGGCAGTSYAGNGQAAYENHQPEKILLPDLQEGHFCGSAGRGCRRHCGGKRAENANDAKQHYHCYSLDASPGIEHHFPEQFISPEDILMEKETEREQEADHALMMERLREGPCHTDARQASCLHARFWEGKQFKEIAEPKLHDISGHCHGSQRHYQVTEILYQARLDEAAKEKAICTKTAPPKRNRKRRARRSPEGNPSA